MPHGAARFTRGIPLDEGVPGARLPALQTHVPTLSCAALLRSPPTSPIAAAGGGGGLSWRLGDVFYCELPPRNPSKKVSKGN